MNLFMNFIKKSLIERRIGKEIKVLREIRVLLLFVLNFSIEF